MDIKKKQRLKKLLKAVLEISPEEMAVNAALADRDVIADPFKAVLRMTDILLSFMQRCVDNEGKDANEMAGILTVMTAMCMDVVTNEIAVRKENGTLGEFIDGVALDVVKNKGIMIKVKRDHEDTKPKTKVKLEDIDTVTKH